MDFVAASPIPERLRGPLRDVLRGEASEWPETLAEDEVQTLIEHGVAPLVYAATNAPALRDEAIRAAAMEPLRAADVAAVLEELARAGVDALLMKGVALAYQLYTSPELRPRGDVDLLIDREHIMKARTTLLALGLRETVASRDEHGVRQMIFTRANGMAYDVHWSVTNLPLFAPLLRYEELHQRAVAIPALGPHAKGLAPEDALLLACIHRVAHHHDSDRLIWLADIALLRARMTPEQHRAFWQRAAVGRVVAICRRSIELAEEWWGRGSEEGAADRHLTGDELAQDELSRVMLDRDITYGRVLFANMRPLTWRERGERVWQLAFPPPQFMRASFGARSSWALPWLYVYRAIRGVGRLFRRARGTP